MNDLDRHFTEQPIFVLSCSTGITAETLGHSLMTQFESIPYRQITIPFIDSYAKAVAAVEQIRAAGRQSGHTPVVFSTLVDPKIRALFSSAECVFYDFFDTFIVPLERELGVESSHTVGRSHGMVDYDSYMARINAINFALANDDGIRDAQFERADVVLIGVSRTGKTPTSLYLALQHGVRAANYPLSEAMLASGRLSAELEPFRGKLFGLTISPERLSRIRSERDASGDDASLERCRAEIEQAQTLFDREEIPWLDTSKQSIEEVASQLVHRAELERRL